MGDGKVAFEVLPGDPASPVILHVPHGSRSIPEWVRERILLDDAELAVELERMTDAGTLQTAEAAARAEPAPWQFVNGLSRLVVDPERFPDDREELSGVGMAAVYRRTSHGAVLRDDDPGHTESLLATFFRPYADGIADLVDDRLAATGRAVIIDVHSYPAQALPYELHASARRPQICIGTDPDHTPAWLLTAARDAWSTFEVVLDQPFTGCYVPLRHYQRDARVASIMVEMRRDVLADPQGAARVARGLTRLVAAAGRVGEARGAPAESQCQTPASTGPGSADRPASQLRQSESGPLRRD